MARCAEGEQMQPWYMSLNPNHTVPTLCDASRKGVWESGAILRHLAGLAGEDVTDMTNVALDWRQSTCYEHFAAIYMPQLGFGGDAVTIPDGINGLQSKMEPVLKHFLDRSGGKFIGGVTPSIADYRYAATTFSVVVAARCPPPAARRCRHDAVIISWCGASAALCRV